MSEPAPAEVLRRAAAQIRNDRGGVVSRNTRDGRRWLPVADLLDDIATGVDLGIAKPTAAVQRALTVARTYLDES